MMNQTKVCFRIGTPLRLRINPQLGEREVSRLSPELDGGLYLWSPEKIRLLRRFGTLWRSRSRAVHVVTANLVLCAVATVFSS